MSSFLTANCDDFAALSALLGKNSNVILSNLSTTMNGTALPNGSEVVTLSSNQLKPESSPVNRVETDLLSQETMDRSSPEMWPEQIPGVTKFLAQSMSPLLGGEEAVGGEPGETSEWMTDLDEDYINMLHGFGSLTTMALLEKVKELQDLAFELGLEESREMTRATLLNLFPEGEAQPRGRASITTRDLR